MIHVCSNSARSFTSRFHTLGAVGTSTAPFELPHNPIGGVDSITTPETDRSLVISPTCSPAVSTRRLLNDCLTARGDDECDLPVAVSRNFLEHMRNIMRCDVVHL